MPQVSIGQTREIYTSFIFFLQMALSDLNDIRDTLPNHCSTVYLFHFVPVIHVTFIIFFIFFNVQSKGYLPLKIDLYT